MAEALAVNALAATAAPATSAVDAPESYDDHLTSLVKWFEQAEQQTHDARKLSERDLDYVHNDQYTQAELEILRKRKQPALIINYCKRKSETMGGLERRMRTDPKAFPRNPADEQGAEAATDALRFVGDQNNFNEIRSAVYEDMRHCGYGGADCVVEETANDPNKVVFKHVPWSRLGYDPHSIKPDFSDAKYKFIVIWKDKDDAEAEWPGREDAIDGTLTFAAGELYRDTPRDELWRDSKRTRVRVVQMHYCWGAEWMLATFTRGGFLVYPIVSPYKDDDGKSACSLHMRSMYVDRDGNRYGAIRDLISLQDEVNKRRSKALHLFTTRQTWGNRQAVSDAHKFREEMNKPDGHVEMRAKAEYGKDFGVFPTNDMAGGQFELLQHATGELQATGANAALAGTDPRGQSGRAQQLQQQAGQVTLEPGIDGLRMWTRDMYGAAWLRIRQFWDAPKWVRVTDDERNLKWVGLNKPVTMGDKLKQLPPEEGRAMAQQLGLSGPYDPRLKEVVEVENEVSGLDVDIIIEEGPDLASLQSEQFETLAGLAKSGVPIPPKAIIQASSIRNKDAILDEMEKGGQLSPETQAQLEEKDKAIADLQKQLQDMQSQAGQEIEKREQALQEFEPAKVQAELQAKNELALQAAEIDARTQLQKAEIDGQTKIKVALITKRADIQAQAMAAAMEPDDELDLEGNPIPKPDPEPEPPDPELVLADAIMVLVAQLAAPKPPMQVVTVTPEGRELISQEVPIG